MDKEEIIEKTFNFAMEYHSKDTSGHDSEHIKRVLNNAKKNIKNRTHS